jgi:DNA processing protein
MRIAEDTADWVSLSLVEGLGPSTFRKLLAGVGSPRMVLGANRLQLIQHCPAEIADRILAESRQEKIDAALQWLSEENHSLITLADDGYPSALLQCPDPPPLLYVAGNAAILGGVSLAIIGSRNATPQGLANSHNFASAIASCGIAVVSGMALGIDTAAHQGAMAGGGATVAVLGCGADIAYPRANAELAFDIVHHGAVVSEFAPGTPPLASNFPRRNRIISGLSQGCLVVEAAMASGSLITARFALEQGREVFAIPGSIHSPLSRGCHALIKQGAKLVETAQDILDELHFGADISKPNILNSESGLLQYIGYDPCDVEMLKKRSGLTAGEVSAMLLALELEGRVGCLPGGLYQRLG